MFLALTSKTLPLTTVDRYAETLLARQLSTLEGVAQVSVFGAAKYAVRIQPDPAALAARGIGIDQLAEAVQRANTNQATGALNGSTTPRIQADGQLQNAAAFRRQIVAYRNGAPVHLERRRRASSTSVRTTRASWSRRARDRRSPISASPARTRSRSSTGQGVLRSSRRRCRTVIARHRSTIGAVDSRRSTTCSSRSCSTRVLVVAVIFLFLRRVVGDDHPDRSRCRSR